MTSEFPDHVGQTPGTLSSSVGTVDVEFVNHAVDGDRHVLDVEVDDELAYRQLQAVTRTGDDVVACFGDARLALLVNRLVVKPLVGVGDRVHHTVVIEGTAR